MPNSGVGQYPKYAFWQPCCRNLPILIVLHFPRSFHWIPRPGKHGSRAKNHFSKSSGRKVMFDTQNTHSGNPGVEIWQP